MKRNVGYGVFLAVILALCCIPSLGMLLPQRGEAGGNQALARLPALRDPEGRVNGEYPAQMLRYLEDNHFLRQEMITAWSALNDRVFGASIAEDVVRGGAGWLYFAGALPDYVGLEPLEDRELFAAARNLSLMEEYCERQGAQFLFTIAPNKSSLYPAHMPRLTVWDGRRNAAGLAAALADQEVPYLDLFSVFQDQAETLYFARDSHWNSKGAALAADALIGVLGGESGYFAGPFTPAANHRGDLYEMLYPAGRDLETDQNYGGTLEFSYDQPIRGPDSLTIRTTGGGEGSLVLFRDSFGNLLYPYLADHFAHALFSRSTYRMDLVRQGEADWVALELVERNLPRLLENVPVMPAPVREPLPTTGTAGACGLSAEESGELEGFLLITGTLPEGGCDGDSPVYLTSEAGWYEAFLLKDGGFGGYVPASARDSLGTAFFQGGALLQAK